MCFMASCIPLSETNQIHILLDLVCKTNCYNLVKKAHQWLFLLRGKKKRFWHPGELASLHQWKHPNQLYNGLVWEPEDTATSQWGSAAWTCWKTAQCITGASLPILWTSTWSVGSRELLTTGKCFTPPFSCNKYWYSYLYHVIYSSCTSHQMQSAFCCLVLINALTKKLNQSNKQTAARVKSMFSWAKPTSERLRELRVASLPHPTWSPRSYCTTKVQHCSLLHEMSLMWRKRNIHTDDVYHLHNPSTLLQTARRQHYQLWQFRELPNSKKTSRERAQRREREAFPLILVQNETFPRWGVRGHTLTVEGDDVTTCSYRAHMRKKEGRFAKTILYSGRSGDSRDRKSVSLQLLSP